MTTGLKIELGQNLHGREALLLVDRFEYDDWIPTLLKINEAKNFKQQKEALGIGIVSVIGSYPGLRASRNGTATARMRHSSIARVRIDDNTSEASLTMVRAGEAVVGYQTPDERCEVPAFAVVNSADEYHRVVRDPLEELGKVESKLGFDVLTSLAEQLHDRYPGFEIYEKLNDAGIDFDSGSF